MKVYLNGKPVSEEALATGGTDNLICLLPAAEWKAGKTAPGLEDMDTIEKREPPGTRFESHEGFDFLSINVLDDPADPKAEPQLVRAWLAKGRLTMVYEAVPAVDKLAQRLEEAAQAGGEEIVPGGALYLFFTLLTQGDGAALQDLEEEITALEEQMVENPPDDSVGAITALRRRLLKLKRYYEGLFDLLEDLLENQNALLTKRLLRAFRLQTDRVDRLSHTVQNLRDYVTQVREAYQNQLDISLNETMRLFTVLTAVFLPLTLIAGWYGMNLQIPAFRVAWAYPVVAAVCLVIAVGSLWYFKRKKWF